MSTGKCHFLFAIAMATFQARLATESIVAQSGQDIGRNRKRQFRFPIKGPVLIDRFMQESAMAQSCVAYVHGWVMRGFESVDPAWHDFSFQFVYQALVYGVVVVDNRPRPATVVPLTAVSLIAEEENGNVGYRVTMSNRGLSPAEDTESPYTVIVYRSPDIYRTKLVSPIYPVIDLHVHLRVMRLLRSQTSMRNVTRPTFLVRADQEDAALKGRMEGVDMMYRALEGDDAALEIESESIGNYYQTLNSLRQTQETASRKRQDAQQQHVQQELDLLQCTALNESIPKYGSLNKLQSLDNGSQVVASPETHITPGEEAMMQYYERQVCECFAVSYDEVMGHRSERISVKNQGMIATLRALLVSTFGQRRFKAKADASVISVSLNGGQILAAAQCGLLDWAVARRAMGFSSTDGLPTPDLAPVLSTSAVPGEKESTDEPAAKKKKPGEKGESSKPEA